MINNVVIEGRIVAPPELKATSNNKKYCAFTLASKKTKEITNFINCVIWEVMAENFVKYLSKGQLISIEGEVVSRSYDGADGAKRYVTEVNAHRFHFIESKKEEAPAPTPAPANYGGITADDLPF